MIQRPLVPTFKKHLPYWLALFILLPLATGIVGAMRAAKDEKTGSVLKTEMFVFGATVGGLSAALTAGENGMNVVVATNLSVIGGQSVASGISAFDDTDGTWENFGMYGKLQSFLAKKYGTSSSKFYGTGEAIAGKVATLPSDIQEFFLAELEATPNVRLLKNVRLKQFEKKGDRFTKAMLEDLYTHEVIEVEFDSMLDGTQTGFVFSQAGIETTFGFDSKESTGETNGLPEKAKELIVAKYGNRGQAISTPFILADKGYYGDFIPVEQACGKDSGISGYTDGNPVWRYVECEAKVTLDTPFKDSYDAYWINHGNTDLRAFVSQPGGVRLTVERNFGKNEQFVKIGTFFSDAQSPLSIQVFSLVGEPLFGEGIIFVKKNMREKSFLTNNRITNIPANQWKSSFMKTSVYLRSENQDAIDLPFTVNGTQFVAQKVGQGTYEATEVGFSRNSALEIPESTQAIVIPSVTDSPEKRIFTDSDAVSDSPTKKIWEFSAERSDRYLLAVDWPDSRWAQMTVMDMASGQDLEKISFKNRNTVRDANPVITLDLLQGHTYSVTFDLLENDWPPMTWSLEPLSRTNAYWIKGEKQELRVNAPGIYDVWINGPKDSSEDLKIGSLEYPVTVTQQYVLQHVGKIFLANDLPLEGWRNSTEILATPAPNVDVFEFETGDAPLPAFSLSSRGYFEGYLTANTDGAPSELPFRELAGSGYSIPLKKEGSLLHFGITLQSTGKPMELGRQIPKGETLYLFEKIPNNSDTYAFSMQNPFFQPLNPSISKQTLFSWRNIVSGPYLRQLDSYDIPRLNAGRNSLGMALVVDLASDYAPVFEKDLDTPELIENSKDFSYAYYYWQKYDSKTTERNLGCSYDALSCNPKRTQPMFGMFPGSNGMFSLIPYYREGRRLVTETITTTADFALRTRNCATEECNESECATFYKNGSACVLDEQKPVLFEDALLATMYPIDLHPFFTRKEPLYMDLKNAGFETNEFTGYLRSIPAKPFSIRLSSLLPKKQTNAYSASSNIGVSQIANGAYRTHLSDMRIGESIALSLVFAKQKRTNPHAILHSKELLRQLQHFIVSKGMLVYPIYDNPDDRVLQAAVQHLIIDGLVTPTPMILPNSSWMRYEVDAKTTVSRDIHASVLGVLPSLKNKSSSITNGDIFMALGFKEEQIREKGASQEKMLRLLPFATLAEQAADLWNKPATVGTLYKAAVFSSYE